MRYLVRLAFTIGAAALLAACGGGASPSPMGASGALPPQSLGSLDFRSLFSFDGSDGARPAADLIAVGNELFGTTTGPDSKPGNIYEINERGVEKVLYTFGSGPVGGQSDSSLLYVKGAFYGSTVNGGKYSAGCVFKMQPRRRPKLLHSFAGGVDGSEPAGGLVLFHNALYGVTLGGGTYDGGTIFSLTLSGRFKTVYNFGNGTDGSGPGAAMTVAGNALYGTTAGGGAHGVGTVFETDGLGKERVVYSFGSRSDDGAYPQGRLIDVNGEFYGTTADGGLYNSDEFPGDGIVFKVSNSGTEEIVHAFQGKADGSHPLTGLVFVRGAFFGTTSGNVPYSYSFGTVFKMSSSGTIDTLHTFNGNDGEQPRTELTLLSGALYGTTYLGGEAGDGTVFRISP